MKHQKLIGILLIAAVFIGVLSWGVYNHVQIQSRDSPAAVSGDTSAAATSDNLYTDSGEMDPAMVEGTLDALSEENRKLREQLEQSKLSGDTAVLERAEAFIKELYDSDSTNVTTLPDRIKPYMTDALHNEMFEGMDSYGGGGQDFQNYVDHIRVFSSVVDDTTANVLILFTLNTASGGVEELIRTTYLFEANFIKQENVWLVSEIVQDQPIRYI